MVTVTETLRSKSLKVTPQRIAILNMLMNTKSHPTAETIFKELEPTNPTMSLATVYKTLDSFASVGIIQVLSIDGESLHYDYNTEFHPHMICKSCKAVCDIDIDITDEINSIKDKLKKETNYSVDRQQLFIYGMCENCN